MFKIIYIILLTLTIVFGNIFLYGNILIRYIAVLLMFFFCIKEKINFPKNYEYKIYAGFILLFAITSLLHGFEVEFIKVLLGAYVVSFVWIWATYILVKKYNSLDTLLFFIAIIGVINAIVTIGQHYKIPFAYTISYFLNVANWDSIDSVTLNSGDVVNSFALFGLFGGVPNGYFSAVSSVIVCHVFYKTKKMWTLVFWLLLLFGLYCVQERAAFVGGVCFSSLYVLKVFFSDRKKILWRGIILLILYILFIYLLLGGEEITSITTGTRFESFELGSRSDIFSSSYNYIIQHPLTANLFDYAYHEKIFPHHLIYYCFMVGGFVGGIIILCVLIRILYQSFRNVCQPLNDSNCTIVLFSFALFAYTIQSLTHNSSIASGDTLFWLLATPVLTNLFFVKNEIWKS